MQVDLAVLSPVASHRCAKPFSRPIGAPIDLPQMWGPCFARRRILRVVWSAARRAIGRSAGRTAIRVAEANPGPRCLRRFLAEIGCLSHRQHPTGSSAWKPSPASTDGKAGRHPNQRSVVYVYQHEPPGNRLDASVPHGQLGLFRGAREFAMASYVGEKSAGIERRRSLGQPDIVRASFRPLLCENSRR